MEFSNNDTKQLFRFVYVLAKQLDELTPTISSIDEIFNNDISQKRTKLRNKCEILIFQDYENIGKKSKEILWRRGYYDSITKIKKILWKRADGSLTNDERDELKEFLLEGIKRFKKIILKFEKKYDLDLRYVIDFSLLNLEENTNEDIIQIENLSDEEKCSNASTNSLGRINYALETVHCFLITIGDLHRYMTDYQIKKISNKINGEINTVSTRELASKYYYEAFKLNPKIGMSQNQLGTLFTGKNYDLDSVYHYLFSLLCKTPFELSENNVNKIFQKNFDYIETLEENNSVNEIINLKDFVARFILITDIFFYDKEVTDFNNLCHFILIELKKILTISRTQKIHGFDENFLYKIISILFFCMSRLRRQNSNKIHNLNAFMVAICSELIDSCLLNIQEYIFDRSNEINQFQLNYNKSFDLFEDKVRNMRTGIKTDFVKENNFVIENENKIIESSLTSGEDKSGESGIIKSVEDDKKETIINNIDDDDDDNNENNDDDGKKKKQQKIRRRRKRLQISEDSDSDDISSNFDSDSDYSLDDESDSESSSDDDDEEGVKIQEKKQEEKEQEKIENKENVELEEETINNIDEDDDGEDVIVEEEEIIYLNEKTNILELIDNFTKINTNELNFINDDVIIEEEEIVYLNGNEPKTNMNSNTNNNHIHNINNENTIIKSDNSDNILNFTQSNENDEKNSVIKFRRKYAKVNPNIIIEFGQNEKTLKSLKLLFDWLRNNNEILTGCFMTNPEFIQKIIKLLNLFNIDIYTRKIYFDQSMINIKDIRKDFRSLFEERNTIPIYEDFTMKNFDLFQTNQKLLDWEINSRLSLTKNEESLIRIFKFVDFGFFLCKMKTFNYSFCARTRNFLETIKKRERRSNRRSNRKRDNSGRRFRGGRPNRIVGRKIEHDVIILKPEIEEEIEERKILLPKKGYLKNKTHALEVKNLNVNEITENKEPEKNKYEIMGKLWLRNEVKTLESKMKKPLNLSLTPYLVMDSKSLTEYTAIVRALVKTKKFVVLIPNAVLSDLDELKKYSEGARNVIRWLEQEFKKGNRFIRSQRDSENLILPLLKTPKKLDRESAVFLQIAQFCNYIVTKQNTDSTADILTLLTGDNLIEKKSNHFSYYGIIDAIPIKFEQIATFYGKYKKK